jgi:glycosyltransferase involved in cell wall biosynthesis
MSFNEASPLVRFSMPCKVTDYMASARPILVYALNYAVVTQYAREEGWAYVVDQLQVEQVAKTILYLKENPHLREQLARRAYEVIQQNHNLAVVQERFYRTLSNITSSSNKNS